MKYGNFYTIGRIFGALAWIVGILTFISSLVIGISLGGLTYLLTGILGGVVWGFLSFIFLYAFSQFIYVTIDIERNTRQTVRALLEEVETEEVETEEAQIEEAQ